MSKQKRYLDVCLTGGFLENESRPEKNIYLLSPATHFQSSVADLLDNVCI